MKGEIFKMQSCYYNGELKYVMNEGDLQECMDLSVYEIVQEMFDSYRSQIESLECDVDYLADDNTDVENERDDLENELNSIKDKLDDIYRSIRFVMDGIKDKDMDNSEIEAKLRSTLNDISEITSGYYY